jgi:hypothetical protein
MRSKICFILIILSSFAFSLQAQSHISTQSHQSAVTCFASLEGVIGEEGSMFSGGMDGFLIKWTSDGLGEHYQISDLSIKLIARNPNGTDIAVYESDGGALNRVSVWNWQTLTRKFGVRFSDQITSLAYSAKGSYIICGTASVTGTIFLNSDTGNVVKKINDPTGVVSMANTSDTEKSVCLYSPSGSISYYDLRTGNRKARFNTEPDLSQVTLFNNNIFAAGIRDGKIIIVQAMTGTGVAQFNAPNAILFSAALDQDLYYIVPDSGKLYKLFIIKNDRNKNVQQPQLIKTFNASKLKSSFSCGKKTGNTLYLGTSDGTLYKLTSDQSSNNDPETVLPLTDNMYDRIYDLAKADDSFFFLTSTAVYKSSYDNGIIDRQGNNPGYTNSIAYGKNVILWSKETKKPVQFLDFSTGTLTSLYTPLNNVQTVRLFGDTLIDIEGNSSVNRCDIATKKFEQLYQGISLQDAVLYNQTELYVAKSSATNPPVPLLYVNTTTKETVPLSLSGTIAYALSYDATVSDAQIYGIVINDNQNGDDKTTSIFSFDPATKSSHSIMKINDEDSDSFTMLSWPVLYTNIGKSQVRSYDMNSNRDFLYKRSASMPLKVSRNDTRMVVLNRDGSISWYNPELSGVLADWYLTTDGQWFEF